MASGITSTESFKSTDPENEHIAMARLRQDVPATEQGNGTPNHSAFLDAIDLKENEESLANVQTQRNYTCFTNGQIFLIFVIITFIGFLGPMSGNIYIPALPLFQTIFHTSTSTINATVSVFMAVFAVGPLLWGAYADVGGRKILYLLSLALMFIVNVLLASLSPNIVALFILRIAQAFASSSVIALGAGTVTDLIVPSARGKAIGYFMMGPNMGPVIAPIVAGLILINTDRWRWLFGFCAIMSGVALLCVWIFLPETLRCIVGNGDPSWKGESPLDIEAQELVECQPAKWQFCADIGIQKPVSNETTFKELYVRPPRAGLKTYWSMIKFRPIFVTASCNALLFANYYAFSVTFSHFLEVSYHYSMLKIGAAYVCPGITMILGSQSGGHLSDFLRKRWKKKNPEKDYPLELRLRLNIVGIVINTAGCIGYGWAISRHFHVALVLFFSALLAFGLTWVNNTTMTYMTELMAHRASAGVAVNSMFRNIAAAISSGIIFLLCEAMGVGWCFTGLGLCNLISIAAITYLVGAAGKWQKATPRI
ncbi:Dtr1p KNAG_0A03540 [Huiozyma naganishii CBS 8797]|uniref:Major facilitator superfamily (MFS) profile domain-containing protein n=1 Tax=Huiozyma naganishii (strain ATCC MYA-139 / BCRC 22969 / CBS 8797 / KCTC 17520 / NBRC 10181 / NCYC 3082 / Yp74L-3) TaxID=1071383 RepID=J7QZV3_HUIN7|nr:hypothetical protein KNAG_0A03540 [Kazachstania naganishii CBS 8797]CCK68035.1 hypothetical protein KNAG_0A03540 [Kazachstania naganishii CBS 8797]